MRKNHLYFTINKMLKQNGISAFSQEAGANVAMHGAPGFGIYGVDIFVKTDDVECVIMMQYCGKEKK